MSEAGLGVGESDDSWTDISQIPSPAGEDLTELNGEQAYPSIAESVQNLGLISFQVERFLQEAQRNQKANSMSQLDLHQADDNSGMYTSESDVSVDALGGRAMIDSLRNNRMNESNNNDRHSSAINYHGHITEEIAGGRLSKGNETLADQLSDSLSFLSRASAMGEKANDLQDFDWLWDWTQPEYFSGQEWKLYAPKQEYLLRQRQLYCAKLNKDHGAGSLFSGEVISLLFLTNILSILIGAGLTYSILMRKPNV